MSNRIIPLMSFAALSLLAGYLGLIVTTISFATWQTEGLSQIRETEVRIAMLEESYYDAIAQINTTDPTAHGLGRPASVKYVTAVTEPTVSFAR